jgi:hypothetical protein
LNRRFLLLVKPVFHEATAELEWPSASSEDKSPKYADANSISYPCSSSRTPSSTNEYFYRTPTLNFIQFLAGFSLGLCLCFILLTLRCI